MIQRIQTIYLLLTAILLGVAMCYPIGVFVDADGVSTSVFTPLHLMLADGTSQLTIGMIGLLLVALIVNVSAIFLYKNRMLQIRVTNFSSLIIIGYYIAAVVFVFLFKSDLEASFRPAVACCFPLIGIILNYLAFRAIMRDEILVRGSDRLRKTA